MTIQMHRPLDVRTESSAHTAGRYLVVSDVAAKVILLFFLVLVLVDPAWGHLEGKAPGTRAITYPLWAMVVPVIWVIQRRRSSFPWLVDLLVTLTCFSDILGNRLDLYDSIGWFDDWMHFMNSALLSVAFVVLTMADGKTFVEIAEAAVAFGVTASLGWELFEYASFLTRSDEWPTAYSDTLGDLVLGWLGSIVAAALVALIGRRRGAGHRVRSHVDVATEATERLTRVVEPLRRWPEQPDIDSGRPRVPDRM